MDKLIDADLPIGADGRIYHFGLKAGELAPRIITVGDETRAKIMAEKLDADTPKFTYRSSRNFLTFTGKYKGVPVSIVMIGMGYPNLDLMFREAVAISDEPLAFIRVGSCGCLKRNDDVVPELAIPVEGSIMVLRNYDYSPDSSSLPYHISKATLPDKDLTNELVEQAYKRLFDRKKLLLTKNATADSFYCSQGRLTKDFKDDNEELIDQLKKADVGSLEMETGQLLYLAKIAKKPIYASAVQIVLADRSGGKLIADPAARAELDAMASEVALEAIVNFKFPEKI